MKYSEFLEKINNLTDLEKVKQNGFYLRYAKKKTPELCLEAVKNNGWALKHVKEQTPELCLEAVNRIDWQDI